MILHTPSGVFGGIMWVWCVPRVVWGLLGVLSSMSQYSMVLVIWFLVLFGDRVIDVF